jgi:hypothetical protein
MKEAVQTALAAIVERYGAERVRAVPDGQGGAWVEISDVDLGDSYTPTTTFVIVLLPFNLPNADVYPMHVRADLNRTDGAGLGEGFSATSVSWPGDPQPRPVTQVSRRTRRSDFTRQTALQKIEKVIDWIRTR